MKKNTEITRVKTLSNLDRPKLLADKIVSFQIFTIFNEEDEKLKSYLEWWSDKTIVEPRMLNKSVSFLQMNLLYAVFAFVGDKLVGAAGLIPCLNRYKQKMYHEEKLVVELASNYVDSDFREGRIGTEFVSKRLLFCKEMNLFPVSVTSSLHIQKIFTRIAIPMKGFKEYGDIYKEVRICECNPLEKLQCKHCPLENKAIWIFKEF